MTKEEFICERTRIVSEMLDNPDVSGIYPTTKCFNELDNLFDKITSDNSDYMSALRVIKEWVESKSILPLEAYINERLNSEEPNCT